VQDGVSVFESLPNLTELSPLVSSHNFAILTTKLPKLVQLTLLLDEESHLSIVADRCPNIKILMLRAHPSVAFAPMIRMESIRKFSNLLILDITCGKVIPPFSQLPKLCELLVFTTHTFTRELCNSLCSEIPSTVRFLSLESITVDMAEIILKSVTLTVMRVYLPSDFEDFRSVFPCARDNPKHFVATSTKEFLWNGALCANSSSGKLLPLQRKYLSYS
jgi:hypothetical protein